MTPQQFFSLARALPGNPIIQLNHARLGFAGYFESGTCGPWRNRAALPICALAIDAMEVLAGFLVCGTQIREMTEDWYALLRHGLLVTATGNSDTHKTASLLGGYPRTYVRMPEDTVGAFEEGAFIAALRGRRAIATSGPFLQLKVNDLDQVGETITGTGAPVSVVIRMQAAGWVPVEEVRLRVNGAVTKTFRVPAARDGRQIFESEPVRVEVPKDSFISAEAYGSRALPGYLVGDFTSDAQVGGAYLCPALPGAEQGMAIFAIANPVFVDANGDGKFRVP
jgi:hypothetical protein